MLYLLGRGLGVIPSVGQTIRTSIPDTKEGIYFEIDKMVEYVKYFSGDPNIIRAARYLVQDCSPKDVECEISTIYDFVCSHVRYVLDPWYKEVLVTPLKMLNEIIEYGVTSEDCDGIATFLATMLAALGHPVRFRFGGNEQVGLHHVWVQARAKNKWIDLDAAERLGYGNFHQFDIYAFREIEES